MTTIGLEAIRARNEHRKTIEHEHCHGDCPVLAEANAEVDALLDEVVRLTICRDGSHVGANLVDCIVVCNCGQVGVRLAVGEASNGWTPGMRGAEWRTRAKAKFLTACAEWADTLIADAIEHAKRDGVRWNFGELGEWMPRIKYEMPGSDELIELPEAQAKVWRAGYTLMLDAYDAAKEARRAGTESDCSCIADFVTAGGVIKPGLVIPCPHINSRVGRTE